MTESINAEFEAYEAAELGDIAVVSEGRYISPKIQNYYKVWNYQQTCITELEAQVTDLELKLLTERGAKAWKDVPDATDFVEELRGNTDKPDCVWKNGDSDEEFETQCGNTFTFIDGGIKDNDCKFCQYCGGAIKEST